MSHSSIQLADSLEGGIGFTAKHGEGCAEVAPTTDIDKFANRIAREAEFLAQTRPNRDAEVLAARLGSVAERVSRGI